MIVSDDFVIYNKEGIQPVLEKMREHINYCLDNIDDDSVPMAVSLGFTMEIAKVRQDVEKMEEDE